MPEVRAEELIVFKPDKAGLSQTEAAIQKIEGARRKFLDDQKKIVESTSKQFSGQLQTLKTVTEQEGKRRENVRAIEGIMRMISVDNEDIKSQIDDYLKKVQAATAAGVAGAEETAKIEREKAEAMLRVLDMMGKESEGEKVKTQEMKNYLRDQRMEILRTKDVYDIKVKEREIRRKMGTEQKAELEVLRKELGLDKEVQKVKLADAKTMKEDVKQEGLRYHFLLKEIELRNRSVKTLEIAGTRIERIDGVQGAVAKKASEWYGTIGRMSIWAAVGAALYTTLRHTQQMIGGSMQVSAHLQQGAVEAENMGVWTGRLQADFGLATDEAINFTKTLAEAGLGAGEIGAQMEKIYAWQYMWGIESSKQVEMIRGIQHNTKTTFDEASGLLDVAISTGREFEDWSIDEVVEQMGIFTKELRGGKMEALTTMALFKTIASTAETVGGHMNVFAGMSRDARTTIMGMVGNMEEMSAQQLVFIARNYEFPKGIEGAAEQVQYLRKAFQGLVPGVDAMEAKARGLGSILKGTVDMMPKGARPVEVEFRMTELLTRMYPELAKAAPEMASKLVPLIPLMESGKNIQDELLAVYKDAKDMVPDQMKTAQDQLSEAVRTSWFNAKMTDILTRILGYIVLGVSMLLGGDKVQEEILDLQKRYPAGKELTLFQGMHGELMEMKDGVMKTVDQQKMDIIRASGVQTKLVDLARGGAVTKFGEAPEGKPAKGEATAPALAAITKALEAKAELLKYDPRYIPKSALPTGATEVRTEEGKRELANLIQVAAKLQHKAPAELQSKLGITLDLTTYYDKRQEEKKHEQRTVKQDKTVQAKGGKKK